ncbi:MAG: class I SAM-dependent methyltransferase [Dehalococcoidia bacterium]|nr:class I SAM-dependent methyltransferase [Dehalococcoidia bacterium]
MYHISQDKSDNQIKRNTTFLLQHRILATERRGAHRAPANVLRRLEVVDLDLLGVRAGDRVLDVGCGVGRLMLRQARRGCRVTGIDLVDRDLPRARRLIEGGGCRADLIVGDAGRLPFDEETFDFVSCTETLEHLADYRLALREVARVLRRGGRSVISVPDPLPELLIFNLSEMYRTDPWGHRRIFSRRGIVRAVEDAGLQVYATRRRNSVEAAYWLLLFLLDACPALGERGVDALNRWRERSNSEPYSLLYHVLDEAGNRFFPKSFVVYARKPPA